MFVIYNQHYQHLGCLLAEEIMAEEVRLLAGAHYSRNPSLTLGFKDCPKLRLSIS